MTLTVSLSPIAEAKLNERAAAEGKEPATYASELLEQVVTRPSAADLLGPARAQVAASGMSDEELDEFFGDVIRKVRAERRAGST